MVDKKLLSKKIAVVSGIIVFLYALTGFFGIPFMGKKLIQDQLSKALTLEVQIEKISVNPFSLTLSLEGFKILDQKKEVMGSVNGVFVNLRATSLFWLTPKVSEILVEKPFIKIIQHPDGSLNISDLIKHPAPEEKTEEKAERTSAKEKTELFPFVLEKVNILNGEVIFEDQKKSITHQIKDFSFSLPYLSSRKKDLATPCHADINFMANGAACHLAIDARPFTPDLSTQAGLKLSDVNIIHYLAYLPLPEKLKLASLGLGMDLKAQFSLKESKPLLLVDGKMEATHAALTGPTDEKVLSFPSLSVDISPSDVLAGQIHISKVLITSPELHVQRSETGELSLLSYMPAEGASPEAKEKKTLPFALELDDFEIQTAVITLKDLAVKKPFETAISPLNLSITRLKAGENLSGEFKAGLKTLFDEKIETAGEFQTGPIKAKGSLVLGNLYFNRYAPYYENLTGLDIKDGAMDLSLEFDASPDENKIMILCKELLVRSLSIQDGKAKQDIIQVPELKVSGSSIDVAGRKIDTGSISAKGGKIQIKRDKKGVINLADAIEPDKSGVKAKEKEAPAVGKKENKESSSKAPEWEIRLNSFNAGGFGVSFEDLSAAEPVNIELTDISIDAQSFSTTGDDKGKIKTQMKWGKTGKIEIAGLVNPMNLNAGLDINLEKIDIKTLQPYFTDIVKILVTDGNINLKGKLLVDMKEKSKEHIEFTGETSVTNFTSLEKKSKEDFFKCNSFYLGGLDVSLFPVKVSSREIALTDFYSKVMVNETGELNLASIFKSDPKEDLPPAKNKQDKNASSPLPDIRIEKITLQGGNIDFSDFLTKPNFKAGMKEISGSLTGLSSDPGSRAKLHLKGLHSSSSPLEIIGAVNPLAQSKFADVTVSFKNIDLSNFTPYSSKYLGYKIEKGKLILDLKYMIDGNALKSENRARFDNFELGEKVDSEHATSLPISLAISLLKNSQGQIDLDLPVEGRLDDPEFRIGPIILKIIGNLILKVVTAPFSFLGSLFGGGGEELSYADFEFGESTIRDSETGKIDKLLKILQEKPTVKLEIQGIYHPVRDAEALRDKRLTGLLIAERSKKAWYSLPFTKTPENAPLTPEDRDKYTEKAYDNAQFPKPRDEKGNLKKLSLEEKRKLLITHLGVDENELRALAMTRAENVKTRILSESKIEKERVYLVEPTVVEKDKTDQSGRAKFILK